MMNLLFRIRALNGSIVRGWKKTHAWRAKRNMTMLITASVSALTALLNLRFCTCLMSLDLSRIYRFHEKSLPAPARGDRLLPTTGTARCLLSALAVAYCRHLPLPVAGNRRIRSLPGYWGRQRHRPPSAGRGSGCASAPSGGSGCCSSTAWRPPDNRCRRAGRG